MKKFIGYILTCIILLSSMTTVVQAFSYKDIAHDKEWDLLELVNKKRAKPVTLCAALQDAAGIRAAELMSGLSHYRPNGEPWYTALDEKGIVYTADSYELIGANFASESEFLSALTATEEGKKLLSAADHIGIGYVEKSGQRNKNAWCVIGTGCVSDIKLSLHYKDIHLSYGGSLDSIDLILEEKCIHGSAYMKVLPSMIKGYNKDKIGTQVLVVEHKGKSAEFIITNDYSDVSKKSWYYNAVMNCTEAGYYSGLGNGIFAPNNEMTREMFVTVLGKLAGINAAQYKGSAFSDVKTSRWSAPYIKWAVDKKIVSGYSDSTFRPTKGITRQEICSVVKRFIDTYGYSLPQINAEKTFTDNASIGAWAKPSVVFCQTRGIIAGDSKGAFNPQKTATRAEVAVIITNLEALIK